MDKKSPEYKKAKAEADKQFKKHSAYKSMFIVKRYKELGGKMTEKTDKGTKKWSLERWKNLTPYALGLVKTIAECPPCGKKHLEQGDNKSICRPTKKINKDTPKLAQSYTKKQIKEALKLKNDSKRINWDKL